MYIRAKTSNYGGLGEFWGFGQVNLANQKLCKAQNGRQGPCDSVAAYNASFRDKTQTDAVRNMNRKTQENFIRRGQQIIAAKKAAAAAKVAAAEKAAAEKAAPPPAPAPTAAPVPTATAATPISIPTSATPKPPRTIQQIINAGNMGMPLSAQELIILQQHQLAQQSPFAPPAAPTPAPAMPTGTLRVGPGPAPAPRPAMPPPVVVAKPPSKAKSLAIPIALGALGALLLLGGGGSPI